MIKEYVLVGDDDSIKNKRAFSMNFNSRATSEGDNDKIEFWQTAETDLAAPPFNFKIAHVLILSEEA